MADPTNVVEMDAYTMQVLPWRGVSRDTMGHYGVRTKVDKNGHPRAIVFPYGNGRTKIRHLEEKVFYTGGQLSSDTGYLFGRDRFAAGSARAITITEGEIDALSVYQMLGSKYPVVSVSGASSARQDCTKDFDFLNSFEKIYLCFDNDEPGQKAVQAVASLFDFNKVYHVRLEFKDANEYLVKGRQEEFVKLWWAAKRFLPEGVISSQAEFDQIIDEDERKDSVPYPFSRLQDMTYGIRTREVNLLTAQEGIGKTEILRAIEYHLLTTTDANIGIIHLEEGKARTLKGLAGYELKTPVHLPDSTASKDDIKAALRRILKRDERVHIYTHFGSDDPDTILNSIRFMAGACNCKYVFLDHITMVVTGLQAEDERKALDYISTRLAMMVEELDFALFLVSHVNDDGLTRGSRNISKVCDLHIHLDRDITAPTQAERNKTYLTIRKNRFAGKTGPAGILEFDPETFMLNETIELPE
jgi:twinkle protein